jgi:rhodanese-related sulfurtransferase
VPEFEKALEMETEAFEKAYGFAKDRLQSTDMLIFSCQSGRRSSEAYSIAQSKGFSKIWNFKGSYRGWLDFKSNPVV